MLPKTVELVAAIDQITSLEMRNVAVSLKYEYYGVSKFKVILFLGECAGWIDPV